MLRGALKHTAVHLNHKGRTIKGLELSDMKQRHLKRFLFHNSYHILYAVKTKISVKNSENSSELFKLTETRFPVQRDLGGEGGRGGNNLHLV